MKQEINPKGYQSGDGIQVVDEVAHSARFLDEVQKVMRL